MMDRPQRLPSCIHGLFNYCIVCDSIGDIKITKQNEISIYQLQKGWQCPVCDAVMSPTFPTCFYCKPKVNMAPTTKTYYVNVFNIEEHIYTGSVFDNENDIEIDKNDNHDGICIKTIEFTVEE